MTTSDDNFGDDNASSNGVTTNIDPEINQLNIGRHEESNTLSVEGDDDVEEKETGASVGHRSKKRRIQEENVSSGHESDGMSSDTDVSIQLLGEREISDDEDDLDLLQALEDSRNGDSVQQTHEGGEQHSVCSTDVEISPEHATEVSQGEDQAVQAPDRLNIQDQEPIDVDAEVLEQQVVEVPASEIPPETATVTKTAHKSVRDYRCPICFEPPETAVMTPCGHVFCVACLFQMINSSRTHRRSGHCALCRTEVKLRDIRMVVLKKKRVKK